MCNSLVGRRLATFVQGIHVEGDLCTKGQMSKGKLPKKTLIQDALKVFSFPPIVWWVGLRMSSVPKPGWSSECLCRISASQLVQKWCVQLKPKPS